mmetsp:Transcript_25647/g.87840  ORF Transcript_25647/g.87840 Transcript_25647/m.87840 type:complete len:358 (-) Transcript_25647:91-1164(-)
MEKTYAMIKPDAVSSGNADSIMQLIEANGFTILAKQKVKMSKEKAGMFYAEHVGKPFYEKLTGFMSRGPVWALALAKDNAIEDWRALMGPTNSDKAREEKPGSIRAIYGTDNTMNATHGSDSPESAARELKFFFPKLTMDPSPSASEARQFIEDKLQPTLVKGLTALCKEKPSAGKMEAITWLANWLQENNPYQAQAYAAADLPLLPDATEEEEDAMIAAAHEAAASGEDMMEGIDAMEAEMAATKLQANFRGYKARKQVGGMKASTGAMDSTMVVIESHDLDQENAAATKMQASFKGHMGRKKVKAMKEEKKKEEAEMTAASTKIQAAHRGRQARKEVAAKKAAAAEASAAPPAEA